MGSLMKTLEELGIKVVGRSAVEVLYELSTKWNSFAQEDKDKILLQFD